MSDWHFFIYYSLIKKTEKIKVQQIDICIKKMNRGQQHQPIVMNTYIPKTLKKIRGWYGHDLMTDYEDSKYKDFVEDMDGHFSNAKIVNFDIIHHMSRRDKLQNPIT